VSVCVRASERTREMEVSANVDSQQNIFYNHNPTTKTHQYNIKTHFHVSGLHVEMC